MDPINEKNIEAWFLDYFEGRLKPKEKAILMNFLKQNLVYYNKFIQESRWMKKTKPLNIFFDEKTEPLSMYLYRSVNRSYSIDLKGPAKFTTPQPQSQLKKEILYGIYQDKKEEWENLCIAYLEGDLSSEKQQEFEEMRKTFPWLETDLKLFKKSIFVPEKIDFPYKNELKKKKSPVIVLWAGAGLAAVAAAMALLLLFQPNQPNPNNNHYNPSNTPIAFAEPIAQKTTEANEANTSKTKGIVYQSVNQSTVSHLPASNREHESLTPLPSLPPKEIVTTTTLNKVDIEPINRIYTAIYANMMERWQAEAQAENKSLAAVVLKPIRALLGKAEESLPGHQPISLWTLAEFTLKGFNTITNNDLELQALRDEKGRLKALAFGNENFKIAHIGKSQSHKIETQENSLHAEPEK